MLFSDESRIQRFGSDGKEYIWRKSNEPPSLFTVKPTVKKEGGNIMVLLGCMSAKGVGWLQQELMEQWIVNYICNPLQDEMTNRVSLVFQ